MKSPLKQPGFGADLGTDINTISIVQSRLSEAVDALEKLNKKAVRYGAEPVTWTLGEPREEKVQTQDGRTVKVMYVELTLSHVEAPLRWGLPVHRPA